MSLTPPNANRLRDAVRGVPVPEDLAGRVKDRIGMEEAGSAARDRIRSAVSGVPVPPFLDSRIRNMISGAPPRSRWFPKLVSAIAAAAVLIALATAYQFGHLRMTRGSQNAYIASVSSRVGVLMSIGLKDHIHCSVFRSYRKNPPTAEELLNPAPERGVNALEPRYAGLIPLVRSLIPGNYRMTLGHKCRYQGREFIHLSFMDGSRVLSLVITRKRDREESFRVEGMLPALSESGIPMYRAGIQRFQISAFETSDYLVYFVSDLDARRNSDLSLALAPPVTEFLGKLEM